MKKFLNGSVNNIYRIFKILFFSISTYVAFLDYNNCLFTENSFNFIYILIFAGLLIFYSKSNFKFDKRTKKYSIIISIIIGVILSIGSHTKQLIDLYQEHFKVSMSIIDFREYNTAYIFNTDSILKIILSVIGFFIIFYHLIGYFLIRQKDIKLSNNSNRKMKKSCFIISVCFMLLSWLPYFLHYYPAIMTNDSYQILNNINQNILSDFNTFGYTFFVGILWKLGLFLFKNQMLATAFYTVIQMVLLANIYNFSIRYFYNKGLHKYVCLVVYLVLCLSPLHACYSVTIWRDILFSAALLLLIICLYEFKTTNFKFNIKYILLFIISIIAVMFFRNNGIYIYIILLPFLFINTKNNRLIMYLIYIFLIVLYYSVKIPIFNYYNVERSKAIEAYSIPLQQISRSVVYDKNLTKEELTEVNKYIRSSLIKYSYVNYISDPIKNISKSKIIERDTRGFINLWYKLFFKHKRSYIEAYLSQTLGYWYPDTPYWTIGMSREYSNFKTENVYNKSLINIKFIDSTFENVDSKENPFAIIIWGIGIRVIAFFLCVCLMLYNNKKKLVFICIPIIALWISLMIATPVFSELRYMYALFLALPFIIGLSLGTPKDK